MKKKIFFIAQGIPPNVRGISGGDKRWLELVRYILKFKKNYNVSVFTSLGGYRTLKDQNLENAKSIILHKSRFLGRFTFFILTFKALFFKASDHKNVENSIVYSAHELLFDVLVALKLKFFFKNQIFWSAIVHWVPPTPFWKRKNSTFFNSLFFYLNQKISMYLINKYADHVITYKTNIPKLKYIKKNDKRLKIQNCGLHFDYSNKILKKNYKKIYDAIFIGRLQQIKGIYDLIEVWRRVCIKHPNKKLVIIGEGINKDEIKLKVNELKLDKNIIFTGYLKDSYEPIKYLAQSKIFLFPSYEEAWAIVIGEAMALKVPVVSYNLEELITVWKNNIKFAKLGNVNSLEKNFLELLSNKKEYQKYSLNSYKFVKQYEWKNIFYEEMKSFDKINF